MGRCRVEGLDELIEEMEQMGNQAMPVFKEMLEIGAEEIKEAWKRSAEKNKLKDTGEMIAAIDWDRHSWKKSNELQTDIYPRGYAKTTSAKTAAGRKVYTRTNKVRHATKAFVLHYGTKRKPATYWVDDAVEDANPKVVEKLYRRWGEYIKGGK